MGKKKRSWCRARNFFKKGPAVARGPFRGRLRDVFTSGRRHDASLLHLCFTCKHNTTHPSMPTDHWLLGRSAALLGSQTGRTVLTVAGTTLAVLTLQRFQRRHVRRALREEVQEAMAQQDAKRRAIHGQQAQHEPQRRDPGFVFADDEQQQQQQQPPVQFDDYLIREFLARNYAFLGEEGCQNVRDAFVVVVGLGGVGSMAATMLARSGVGRIRCGVAQFHWK